MKNILLLGILFICLLIIDGVSSLNFLGEFPYVHAHEILEGFFCDIFTAALLLISFALSIIVFILSEEVNRINNCGKKTNRIWILLSTGFFIGSMDEIFDIHCIFDYWESTAALEEMIPIVYAACGVGLIVIIWNFLKKEKLSPLFLYFGLGFQITALFCSTVDPVDYEEICEFLAALMYLEFIIMSLRSYYAKICSSFQN